MQIWPGQSDPLGATFDGSGTNFAVFSEVAERVGRSKPSVSNRVRLLELPEDVLWMLARGDLTEGHARAVLALPDDDARRRLARRISEDGLTVRAAEKAARDGGWKP